MSEVTRLVPTEAEINALAETVGVTAEQYFVWRRRLIHGITRRNESWLEAVAAATRPALELTDNEWPARVIITPETMPGLTQALKEVPHE